MKSLRRTNFPVIYAIIVLLAGACAPAYVPNVINTPLISKAGEFNASIYTGTSGIDPQLSLGVTDHFGIMLNGSFASRTSDSTDDFHKHFFVEMAPCYYSVFEENGRFELYGGFGFGKIQAEFDNNLWISRSNVSYYRFFLQPSIGYASNYFDASLATRIVMVNIQQESNRNTGFFFEPAGTIKVGMPSFKFVFQLGVSVPVNSDRIEFNYQPFMFSVGLQGTLGRMNK